LAKFVGVAKGVALLALAFLGDKLTQIGLFLFCHLAKASMEANNAVVFAYKASPMGVHIVSTPPMNPSYRYLSEVYSSRNISL